MIQEPKMLGEPIVKINTLSSYLTISMILLNQLYSLLIANLLHGDYAMSTHQITAYNYSLNEFKVTTITSIVMFLKLC